MDKKIIKEMTEQFKQNFAEVLEKSKETVTKDDKNEIQDALNELKKFKSEVRRKLDFEFMFLSSLLKELYLRENGFYTFKKTYKDILNMKPSEVSEKDYPLIAEAQLAFDELPNKVKDYMPFEEERLYMLSDILSADSQTVIAFKKKHHIIHQSVQSVEPKDQKFINETLLEYKKLTFKQKLKLKAEIEHLHTLLSEIQLIEDGYYTFLESHHIIINKRIDQLTPDDLDRVNHALTDYKDQKKRVKRKLKKEYKHLLKLKQELNIFALGYLEFLKTHEAILLIRPNTVEKEHTKSILEALLAIKALAYPVRKKLKPTTAQLQLLLKEITYKESIRAYIKKHEKVFEYKEIEIKEKYQAEYDKALTDWLKLKPIVRMRMVHSHGAKGVGERTYFWQKRVINETYHNQPKTWIPVTIGLSILLIVSLWSLAAIQFRFVNQQGIAVVKSIASAMISPNIDWLTRFDRVGIPYQMLETVAIAFLGTFVGAILAIPFAFVSSRNITGRFYSFIGTIAVTMIRTFPVFILGLMFVKVTGPGPFAGVMTIGVASIGMMTKLYVESIEDIDKGILEALDATGATTFQKIRFGIMPQLIANFVSNTLYRFEINVRNATILGLVGAGGIGSTLIWAMAAYRWKDAAAALIGIIVVVLVIEVISTKLRRKIGTGE